MTPKLILTGFMATGKTAVGHAVAARLGWELIDTDAEIVRRAGKPIAQIFTEEGEARFREIEREVIRSIGGNPRRCPLCHGHYPAVVSTGGGALVDDTNCAALKQTGVVVCLTARPEVIAARVERSHTRRPKLMKGGKSVLERINELLAERALAYARADVSVDTSDISIAEAAERVIEGFNTYKRCKPSA